MDLSKAFEFLRYGLCGLSLGIAYGSETPADVATWLLIATSVSLSLLTGIETYVIPIKSPEGSKLGWASSPYRYQSANNNLAIGLVAILLLLTNQPPTAMASVASVSVIFFALNGILHTLEGFRGEGTRAQSRFNILFRGVPSLALLLGCLPLLAQLFG
jgi:hypothetical protein